jgi:hypothetical protein
MAGLEMIPAERRASWRAHRAEAGDSLALLATRYRATIASIHAANGITGEELNPGSLVVIPAAPQPVFAKVVKPPVRTAARRTTGKSTVPVRTAARGAVPAKPLAKAAVKPVRKAATTAVRPTAKRRQG